MKLKSLFLACLVSLFAAPVFAQSTATISETISGVWEGDAGLTAATRTPITITLKVDGRGVISGVITGPRRPGDIKTGSYDPKTSALKFEVEVRDDPAARFFFEGAVADGAATGRVSGPGVTGDFKVIKATEGPTASAQSNGPAKLDTATALRKGFGQVSGWVLKAADLTPADKYSYKPTESVRTFGQVIAHIADSYNYYCAAATGAKTQWSDAVEKGPLDKATLVQKLKQATSACEAVYGSGQAPPLIENIGHTNLHYGNIITYMRMMGMTPPSS